MDYLISNFGMIKAFVIAISIVFIRYLFFSGITYSVFYLFKKKALKHKRIQKNYPKAIKIKNEIKHSFFTAIVFGGIGLFIYALKINGFTKIYTDFSLYGLEYFIFSILIMLLIHDTYFYWMHRLVHHPKLFGIVHKIHHQSRNPTPFTAFSFDITEAIIEAAIIPIIILVLPVHPLAIFIFFNISLAFNIMGHLGYEFLPPWFINHPVLKWINTSTHHNMHHQKGNANYGLYFNFWDTLMKTNHKQYQKKFYAITSKNKKKSIAA
ncbi:sterol desaturase family protein [Psychroserpens ponticola]|uniref:Sterol desaturase family protein n=1 Tax=Psychroserpens ponticola TaxID=2932268 RepID=A0ABY7S0V2_9FLAO|nr:sterol desaturase family protein [Psychroserpens ponticola]WCO02794.1 sterol desaturase family protein [Psychroserpens ponticola]